MDKLQSQQSQEHGKSQAKLCEEWYEYASKLLKKNPNGYAKTEELLEYWKKI